MNRSCAFAAFALACLSVSARADEPSASECSTLTDAAAEVKAAGGGVFKSLTHEQLLFARGVFVGTPPVSNYPPGENGVIALFDDGGSAVVFTDGDKACGKMGISPHVTKLLLAIDGSI